MAAKQDSRTLLTRAFAAIPPEDRQHIPDSVRAEVEGWAEPIRERALKAYAMLLLDQLRERALQRQDFEEARREIEDEREYAYNSGMDPSYWCRACEYGVCDEH